jgi:DNA-binding winged helix-turn-helix (wHTH) protein
MPAGGWTVIYRFDDFALDTGTRRLLHAGTEARLSPKAFDLLHLLIANASRALSKSELVAQLWPSTHVLETNLASLIAEIRRTLNDAADTPRYVRTMHRFGYWFIAPVSTESDQNHGCPVRYWLFCDARQVALSEGENILGRAPDAAVWIDAPGVSRHHARIRIDGTQATVEDLGSKNGTFVQGRRIAGPSPLDDGNQIRLGSFVVTFRIPPPADSTLTAPDS